MLLVEVDEEAATHHWSHVPGAAFLDWHDQIRPLTGPAPQATQAFVRVMSALGARPDTHVVLYGDASNQFAASALWLFRYHGHARLSLMDGGRAAWVRQGRVLTGDSTVRRPTAYNAAPGATAVRASRDDVLAHLRGQVPGGLVVDCRPEEAFVGHLLEQPSSHEQPAPARGHVPGAVNLPIRVLLRDDGSLLPPQDLEATVRAHGLTPDRTITTYCHLSDRGALAWFVLQEVLGWPSVRVYDGGWWEYSHLLGVPVVADDESVPAAAPLPRPVQQVQA